MGIRISVIIAARNEARNIGGTVRNAFGNGASEVIVADGGSADATIARARAAGVRVIECPVPGRAAQMNAGARAATGDLLVFLHADTRFRPGALAALARAARRASLVGGAFHRDFVPSPPLLSAWCFLGNLRGHLFGWYFGDQAIWCRREAFNKVDGYPVLPLFEDLEFSRRLAGHGSLRTIRPGVVTSARRFRGGMPQRMMGDFKLTVGYIWRLLFSNRR